MSRWIDADHLRKWILSWWERTEPTSEYLKGGDILDQIDREPSIDIVCCRECKKSHIDGKTTHYLWCVEWGRSTDVFGYCERGEREGE